MITEIVTIKDPCTPEARAALARAKEILSRGGLVVFPTETVYGLGADATNAHAAAAIYAAKGRPSDNPLIVHVKDPKDASLYAETCPLYDRLAAAFMPGSLTVIMPAKESIPKTVTAGLSTVAIRCPLHPVAHALLCVSGLPIAAPSANLSGSPSPTCARHVIEDMNGRVDMIIDGGDCEIGVESTIVKIDGEDTLTLLRPGAITPEMLSRVAKTVNIADAVLDRLAEGETVLSPGMKYRHYAPHTPLALLKGEREEAIAYLRAQPGKIALLCYSEDLPIYEQKLPHARCYPLGERARMDEQAHRLFTLLRDLDKENCDAIFAPLPPKVGMGMALYNRMIRAAAHHIVDLEEKEQS